MHEVGVSYRWVVWKCQQLPSRKSTRVSFPYFEQAKHHVTNTEETHCFLSKEFEAERRNTNVNEERNAAKTTGEDACRDEGVWDAASLGVPHVQEDLSQYRKR